MSTRTINRPYLTPPEAADEAGIAAEKVCGWIRTGELRASNVATRLGGPPRWRIHRADWAAFLASRANSTPSARAPRRKAAKGFREFIPPD